MRIAGLTWDKCCWNAVNPCLKYVCLEGQHHWFNHTHFNNTSFNCVWKSNVKALNPIIQLHPISVSHPSLWLHLNLTKTFSFPKYYDRKCGNKRWYFAHQIILPCGWVSFVVDRVRGFFEHMGAVTEKHRVPRSRVVFDLRSTGYVRGIQTVGHGYRRSWVRLLEEKRREEKGRDYKRIDKSWNKETKQKTVKDGGKSNDLDHDGKVSRMNYYLV